jgi:hypothetical protein
MYIQYYTFLLLLQSLLLYHIDTKTIRCFEINIGLCIKTSPASYTCYQRLPRDARRRVSSVEACAVPRVVFALFTMSYRRRDDGRRDSQR